MYNKQSSLGGIHKFNSKGVMRNRFGEFLSLKNKKYKNKIIFLFIKVLKWEIQYLILLKQKTI